MQLPKRNPFRKPTLPAWGTGLIIISSYSGHLKRFKDFLAWGWTGMTTSPHAVSIVVILCALWIVLAMYWPEPKLLVYRMFGQTPKPKPLPPSGRLDAIEPVIRELSTFHEGYGKEHGYVQRNHEDLLSKTNIWARRTIEGFQSLPAHIWVEIRFFEIIRQSVVILASFERLRDMHGASIEPASRPFSLWRQPKGTIETQALMEWEHWARDLENHIKYCTQFFVGHGMPFDGGDLFRSVGQWGYVNTEMSGGALHTHLQVHGTALVRFRDSYAINFSVQVEKTFTT